MKLLSIIILAWLNMINQAGQDLYACKNVQVTIFSQAPVEDIQANTSSGASVYNVSTGDLIFNIPIKSLHFPKQRMQEHFNENYMESDKYPNASFKGKIQEHVDVTKDGSYQVTAVGDLDVHGVKQKRSIPGTITIKGGVISMKSEFMVKCVDHHIEIPKIVFYNIAESIKVTASATYQPSK